MKIKMYYCGSMDRVTGLNHPGSNLTLVPQNSVILDDTGTTLHFINVQRGIS